MHDVLPSIIGLLTLLVRISYPLTWMYHREMGAGQCIAVYAEAVRRLNSLMVNAGSDGETGAEQCIVVYGWSHMGD